MLTRDDLVSFVTIGWKPGSSEGHTEGVRDYKASATVDVQVDIRMPQAEYETLKGNHQEKLNLISERAQAILISRIYGEIHGRLNFIDRHLNAMLSCLGNVVDTDDVESAREMVRGLINDLDRLQYDEPQTQVPMWCSPTDEKPMGGADTKPGGTQSVEVSGLRMEVEEQSTIRPEPEGP